MFDRLIKKFRIGAHSTDGAYFSVLPWRLPLSLEVSPCLGEGVIDRREMTAMHLGKNRLFNVFR